MLGLTGESKRRTMTRYEKGERKPKLKRLNKLSRILLTDISLIKEYDFQNETDIIYFILWLDELFPNIYIDLNTNNYKINGIPIRTDGGIERFRVTILGHNLIDNCLE